jgi:hypothetical protein
MVGGGVQVFGELRRKVNPQETNRIFSMDKHFS